MNMPFQIRRTDMEVAGDKLHRFELIDTTRGNMVLCVARQQSATPPEWIRKRCINYNLEVAHASTKAGLDEIIAQAIRENTP